MNTPSYMIKHRLVTKHVAVVQCGQTISNMLYHFPNVQNVLQCFLKCLSAFKLYQTRSNKVFERENVWFPNNLCSCLIAKHFPCRQGFDDSHNIMVQGDEIPSEDIELL